MTSNNVTTTGIVSKTETLVVDSVPQHSNSDISGSVNPFQEKTADQNSVKWTGDLNDRIQLILNSPLLIGVLIGLAVALILAFIIVYLVISLWRLDFQNLITLVT